MRIAITTIFVAAVVLASPSAAQSWRVTSERDPFNDQPNVRAYVQGRGYVMAVRCKSGLLETLFLGGYVGEEDANVRYRIDSGEVQSDVWDASTSRDGLFADAPGEVARWMAGGSRMAFEYEDFAGTPHQYSIPLSGSAAAIGEVLDACGVPRGDPRAQDNNIWRRVVIDIDKIERSAVRALQERLAERGYEVTPNGRRDIPTYQALTTFYAGYWSDCRAGDERTTSCTAWRSSLQYNADADYAKEPIDLFIEVMREGISKDNDASSAAAPGVITNPSWSRNPSGDFPERALTNGITSGTVRLNCLASANGSLTDCSVLSEDPAGAGFAQSALAATRRARLSPRTVDSAPAGARVQWTVRFHAEQSVAPAPTPAAEEPAEEPSA